MTSHVKTRKFTTDEYERMVETGVLTEQDNVELINGKILKMPPIGKRHAACVTLLTGNLYRVIDKKALIRVQDPVRIDDKNEPEPDIAVVKPREDAYASGHPTPDQTFFVVEVAGTSLDFDREQKIPLYARAGIKETWLVDLDQNTLTQHLHPSGKTYSQVREVKSGETISPSTFPDVKIPVDDIIPAE